VKNGHENLGVGEHVGPLGDGAGDDLKLSEVLSALSYVLDMVEGQPPTSPTWPPPTTNGSTAPATTGASPPKNLDAPARILAVAGAFDALCSDRHYRSAMPLDKVFYILTADDRFDPEIIEALRILVERAR
jgi:hypothetical protein